MKNENCKERYLLMKAEIEMLKSLILKGSLLLLSGNKNTILKFKKEAIEESSNEIANNECMSQETKFKATKMSINSIEHLFSKVSINDEEKIEKYQ